MKHYELAFKDMNINIVFKVVHGGGVSYYGDITDQDKNVGDYFDIRINK